ncbi:MAG: iron uptake porin [Synechococcaceae cyanobacterium SM2_3_2]|nr:iron uptake porin [Synechococcaceae cyanobacterium SM2_3_2]
MPANYWKSLLAGTLGAAAVLTPGVMQAPAMAQASGPVTAISELSDVQPTDWAFQALQSLVERYGCIAGYPDRTYRGNRAMTRFEFAAGMNACLDRINELIAAGLADKVSREDLATLQRLQEEFAAELAALRGRVDILEADVADLRSKIFNPVTKLNAQVITALVGAGLTEDRVDGNGNLITDASAANFTLPYRVRLNFDASFVGSDRLRIRLQARDAVTPSDVLGGAADPGLAFGGSNQGGNVRLTTLTYRFRIFDNTTVSIGAVGQGTDERIAYGSPFSSLSSFNDDAPYIFGPAGDAPGDAGIAFNTNVGDLFRVAYGYGTDNAQTPGTFGEETGITGGDSFHAVELAFTPTETVGVYFSFGTGYIEDATGLGGDFLRGPVNGANDPVDGTYARINGFGIAADWEITPRVILSGWFASANVGYELPETIPAGTFDPGDEDVTSFLVGFLFPDLFLEGGEGGVSFGQPPVNTDVVESNPFIFDVYYSIPVNDFLNIIPSAYFVSNPNGGGVNGANDPTIGVGAVRAEFNF